MKTLFAIALLAVACGDPAEPPLDPTGTYVLQEVDSDPLPFLYHVGTCLPPPDHKEAEWRFWWTEGSVTFAPDGTGAVVRRTEEECVGHWSGPTYNQAYGFTYVVDGEAVSLTFEDGATTASHLAFDGPVLRMTFARGSTAYDLRLVRSP